MLETHEMNTNSQPDSQIQSSTSERKLNKEGFNFFHRFRKAREGCSINCSSCAFMSGVRSGKGEAFCNNPGRSREIRLMENRGWGEREDYSIASEYVCNALKSKEPLPKGVIIPSLPEKHFILLGTQSREIYHADPNCPYVSEELRMANDGSNSRADVHIVDRSELVPMEVIGHAICEMPCCDTKLPYQTFRVDDYKRRVGIKPDGSEPRRWVKNETIMHERKVAKTLEEAEAVFDLKVFNSSKFGDEEGRKHNRICAALYYLRQNCNTLGSRPLSEAANPVGVSNRHHILRNPSLNPQGCLEFLVYDERLFDFNRKRGELAPPIRNLESIPEGIILCIDTQKFLSNMDGYNVSLSNLELYGIVKPLDDSNLVSRGMTNYMDVRAASYHWHDLIGAFGKDFMGLERFDEE